VACLLRVREVQGSHLGPQTAFAEGNLGVFLSISLQMPDSTSYVADSASFYILPSSVIAELFEAVVVT